MHVRLPRRGHWHGALAALLLLASPAAADTASEDSVKAAFILNFTKYVEWPATALGGGELKVCSLDTQPLSGKLAEIQGRQIHGRTVQVRQGVRADEWRSCHVVFISAAEGERQDAALRAVAGAPVLTVGDGASFAQAGGIISLKLRGARVRFDINLGAARRAGLNPSSQLLKLADEVVQ